MTDKKLHPQTIAAHGGGATGAKGAVVPDIQLATTFARGVDYILPDPRNLYLRDDNDTVRQAEEVIRRLEGATESLLFASGMAASSALFRSVPKGGRIIAQSGIYYGTTHFLRGFCDRQDITLTEVDTTDPAAFQVAVAETADLIWVELPSNPWMKVTDMAFAADMAERAGAILAVDATASTPLITTPLHLGADVVMHSATKAMNGHSDVLAGVLSVADPALPIWQAARAERHDAGAVMGPFEAWLLLRGLRTLPLRLKQMCTSAQIIAERLQAHPDIQAVWYPGLASHPQHKVAQAQMSGGYGYLMSILVKGNADRALEVAGRLRLIQRATSLGGVESLIEHRHSIEPHSGIPPGLLRLSVGIEAVEDLLDDFLRALGN